MKVIGITGTKGKTTTTFMIKSILENAGYKVGLIGTIETIIGDKHIPANNTTPESYIVQEYFAEMLKEGCEVCVMEVSSQGLMMHRTAGIPFEIGIFTNLAPDHIGPNEHSSFEEYAACKGMLFKQCKVGIANVDDENFEMVMKDHTCTLETIGFSEKADLRASNVNLVGRPGYLGVTYDLTGLLNLPVEIDIPGKFSVYNSLVAIAVCRHFYIQKENILEALKAAIAENKAGRASGVETEIAFALEHAKIADVVVSRMETGEVPVRVTHNDTKIDNILFDRETGEAICVIDLDTVMPGSMLYDFGDALRMGASTGAEDEVDLSKVCFDKEAFRAFAKGYLEELGADLTEAEIELLPISAALLTYECGIRFLTDYLNGDTYFKIHRENHNLDRARNQFKLVTDILELEDELKAIVAELREEYRMNRKHAKLLEAMTHYDKGATGRIQHFYKVHDLSATIGALEGLDEETQFILETAAIVHDIGIKISKEKYGSSTGKYQELEGPGEAEAMMRSLGGYTEAQIDRVKYLVGHHHTYDNIDGIDYQILVEADFLVNLHENGNKYSAIMETENKIFKTEAGIRLLRSMFEEQYQ